MAAVLMSRSTAWRVISRLGASSLSEMRAFPIEVQRSRSSSKRSTYRLGGAFLESLKVRFSSGMEASVPKGGYEGGAASRRLLLRSLHAASIHLPYARAAQGRTAHAARDPARDHAA